MFCKNKKNIYIRTTHLFGGQLTVLVQSGSEPGDILVEVTGKGLKKQTCRVFSQRCKM